MKTQARKLLTDYVALHGERETARVTGLSRDAIQGCLKDAEPRLATRRRLAKIGIPQKSWTMPVAPQSAPRLLPEEPSMPEPPRGDDIQEVIRELRTQLRAEGTSWRDRRAIVLAIASMHKLLAKTRGEVDVSAAAVIRSPYFAKALNAILDPLEKYPEALADVRATVKRLIAEAA